MVKNSKKHFYKTLLINSPFDLEILAFKQVEKTFETMGKTSLKTLLKSCRKQSKGSPFYRLLKCDHWRPTQQTGLLSVDRPIDRPTVRFLTVVPAVNRPIDRCLANDPAVDRPVNRAISREQRLSGGRLHGRPAQAMYVCAHRSTGAVD